MKTQLALRFFDCFLYLRPLKLSFCSLSAIISVLEGDIPKDVQESISKVEVCVPAYNSQWTWQIEPFEIKKIGGKT
jgi:hypothetical protein